MGCPRKGHVYHFELAALSQTVKPAWCFSSETLLTNSPEREKGCRVIRKAIASTPTYTSDARPNIQRACQGPLLARTSSQGATSRTHTPVHLVATASPTQIAAPANHDRDRAQSVRAREAKTKTVSGVSSSAMRAYDMKKPSMATNAAVRSPTRALSKTRAA